MKNLFTELRRRKVFRVAGLYAVVGWLLAQIAVVLETAVGLPMWFDGFVVAILLIGFPVAILLAWAFEISPDGVVRAESGPDATTQFVNSSVVDYGIIAGLVLVLMAIGWNTIFAVKKGAATRAEEALAAASAMQSIAVLPFVDLSPEKNQEFFSDGLSEELLNILAKIPDLRVAARTSSFAFKNKDAQISEIAQTLNVRHVLEGSVRKSGDRLRVTAQLIDGENGYHLFSQNYDATLDDVFRIQDDIAKKIVDSLKVEIMGSPINSVSAQKDAYALFLEARHYNKQYTQNALKTAEELLLEAIELDPDYPPIWVYLSSVYINQINNGHLSEEKGCPEARNAGMRSLDIDPRMGVAYAGLASLATMCDRDLRLAARYFERALELDPNNISIIGDAAVFAELLGKIDLSIRGKEYQVAHHPVEPVARNNLGLGYYFSGDLDAADAAFEKTLEISPGYIGAHYRRGIVQLFKGDTNAAQQSFAREIDDEYRTKGQALVAFASGDKVAANKSLQALIDGWGDIWPGEVAQVYAYRGELDAAFQWLDRLTEMQDQAHWGEQRLDPLFDPLRDDPRWQPFLAKMGVSDEQLSVIEFSFPEFNVEAPSRAP